MRTRNLAPVLLAGALGCGGDAVPSTTNAPPAAALLVVDTATMDVPLAAPAQLYVENDAVVYARSSGIVQSIEADLGERVAQDELLAQLEHVDQEIALEQARVALDVARRAWERARGLAGTGVLSPADSERAESDYRMAQLAERQAERDYELTRVVAPFAGAVTSRRVRPRRLVTEGDTLFRVTALAPLRVAVHLPERASGSITRGDSGTVVSLDGAAAVARVIRASPIIDAASGTREIVLQLESGSGLLPGASVTVHVGSERRRVVAIPQSAITEGGHVLVWDHGRPVLRAVTLGARLPDDRLEVVSGLDPGEQVLRSAR